MLTAHEIQRFHDEGYLSISRPALSTTDLRRLESLLLPLFGRVEEIPPEWVHDLGQPSTSPATSIPELVHTAELDPRIKLTASYRKMRAIAAELLGAPATLSFDHVILKRAHSLATTPWHQDFAFNLDDRAKTVNFWIPLTDVTSENGCMRFIPGSHRVEPLQHVGDGPDALRALDVPEETMVSCPIGAGGFTVHTQRTLHSTGPNVSDADRLAWIAKFKADDRTSSQRVAERTRAGLRAARRAVRSERRSVSTAARSTR